MESSSDTITSPGRVVLVTGCGGFLGRHLVNRLLSANVSVRGISRTDEFRFPCFRCDVGSDEGWKEAMDGVEAVFHLAGRTPGRSKNPDETLEGFRKINVEGTMRIARIAADCGVRKLVMISSVKAVGELAGTGQCYSTNQSGKPADPYGVSKAEAEEALLSEWGGERESALEVVVVRPPLIYGNGVKGNLRQIKKLVDLGIPVPFGSLTNERDMIGVENLCGFLCHLLAVKGGGGNRFVVSDGQAVSTAKLFETLGKFSGRKRTVFPFPPALVRGLLSAMGMRAIWDRLGGDSRVDMSVTQRLTGWTPEFSFEDGIERWVRGDADENCSG
ncbi:MAG: NAD-dependent epimerase/dehydratase family protein [Verrucomicrobiales bacterium]|nr:NAD-dependent epimerase/dehydratase family protein [Verrucomicrobiales bacterium]